MLAVRPDGSAVRTMPWARSPAIALLLGFGHLGYATSAQAPAEHPTELSLQARIVATGLQRAYGVRQVGRFHSGGPFTANAEFLLQTQAGRVLDPQRVLIAVQSNLGAPLANASHAAGAVISVDPREASDARPLAVPADLAARPAPEHAAVMLYSAQSPRFLNSRHNGTAHSADVAGVAGPRYLSINNAFGRPWLANAPFGLQGPGSESVLDPDGAPLANAPSDDAGGVFFGAATGRTSVPRAVRSGWLEPLFNRRASGQLTAGAIDRGAYGTALMGASPDGSGFAVFAVVTGAGAVLQVHVRDGVDGLAPPGTIAVGPDDPGLIGVAFKWSPDRILYIADALRDRIAVLHLGDDERHFKVTRTTTLESPWLRQPVDLAACVPEVASPRFASHTTLAGSSDLYVVSRGDGAIVRMRLDGTVVARALVRWPDGRAVGGERLRSIAVSANGDRVWLVAERGADGAHGDSVLLEASGFDAGGAFVSQSNLTAPPRADTAAEGARLFASALAPRTADRRFNATTCVACHPGPGGASSNEEHFARRIARMDPVSGRVLVSADRVAAIAPRHAQGTSGDTDEALPRGANVVSLRMPSALAAAGRLDDIADAVIEAQAVSKGDGIKGRVHYVTSADGARRVGRYGWKADVARLDEMVAEAMANEMGIRSALTEEAATVHSLSAYLRTLSAQPQPPPGVRVEARR